MAYADEPARTGIANRPVPIIPRANMTSAISPEYGNVFTRGWRAFAASSEVDTSVTPQA
jgi:hypothetical protein